MSVTSIAAIGFGVIIKGDDTETIERINRLCQGNDNLFESSGDLLEAFGFEHLSAEIAGGALFGYQAHDVVIVVVDTYRNFDIMSSDFAGVFRVGEDGVSDEAIDELRMFCQKIGLETTASWLAWNKAS